MGEKDESIFGRSCLERKQLVVISVDCDWNLRSVRAVTVIEMT